MGGSRMNQNVMIQEALEVLKRGYLLDGDEITVRVNGGRVKLKAYGEALTVNVYRNKKISLDKDIVHDNLEL
ncbi:hypothetical protein PQE74_gp029 [Bacillus phage vB_BanS_Chewbecca]|uniref:Uncharacterized protein n=1 Tax=Bacillus phage vB_BanS_Chewbecca TaxID=2894786 RepID=A0AAE9CAU3_9CAUD|nr:hypothetical protein PQE74_gp029 [Bacillus phage vB_BanS_Chewbecca]UGO46112.1 hypothetical protein CHEWBECCA_29 [Bacillus phage vB_BanS_Chewbecca]